MHSLMKSFVVGLLLIGSVIGTSATFFVQHLVHASRASESASPPSRMAMTVEEATALDAALTHLNVISMRLDNEAKPWLERANAICVRHDIQLGEINKSVTVDWATGQILDVNPIDHKTHPRLVAVAPKPAAMAPAPPGNGQGAAAVAENKTAAELDALKAQHPEAFKGGEKVIAPLVTAPKK